MVTAEQMPPLCFKLTAQQAKPFTYGNDDAKNATKLQQSSFRWNNSCEKVLYYTGSKNNKHIKMDTKIFQLHL